MTVTFWAVFWPGGAQIGVLGSPGFPKTPFIVSVYIHCSKEQKAEDLVESSKIYVKFEEIHQNPGNLDGNGSESEGH